MRRAAVVLMATVALLLAGLGGGTAAAQSRQAPGEPGPVARGNPAFTANAMAPLQVVDWTDFAADLRTAEAYGLDAVSVDVWWGIVERAGDNRFDWSYYDRVFATITAAGLDIAPILSFHQCGGNVGDDCDVPLPPWLWQKYANRTLDGVKIGPDGLKHRSEQGNRSPETVQGWADRLVLGEYRDLTRAFVDHYGRTYADRVIEINVSLGPSGELRYPSYNAHDTGSGYPTRGALQSYSELAVRDFRADMLRTYGTLEKLNKVWDTKLTSEDDIGPPADAEAFFTSGEYRKRRYGRDFVDWYNGSLVEHGERMLTIVVGTLGRSFPRAKIGYKVPGIHWTMTHPVHPRATEVTTGLVQTGRGLTTSDGGHGYRRVIELAKHVGGSRTVVLHFTALEMDDRPAPPDHSLAKTLVGWVGAYAHRAGVELKGENALAGGVTGERGWDNINEAFDRWGYLGLTVLRVGDVAEGVGAKRYAEFIAKYRPPAVRVPAA